MRIDGIHSEHEMLEELEMVPLEQVLALSNLGSAAAFEQADRTQ